MARNEDYSDDDQDYQDEPNFDDPEGFVDDVGDDGKILQCQHGRYRLSYNITSL